MHSFTTNIQKAKQTDLRFINDVVQWELDRYDLNSYANADLTVRISWEEDPIFGDYAFSCDLLPD